MIPVASQPSVHCNLTAMLTANDLAPSKPKKQSISRLAVAWALVPFCLQYLPRRSALS